MKIPFRQPRPEPQHVSDRDNIILKAVFHELAIELGTELIPTAHAAGSDRQATRMAREIASHADTEFDA